MEINEFLNCLAEEIKKLIPNDSELRINTVQKNNGVLFHGISILTKDVNIAPTIYLDSLYRKYQEKGTDFETMAREFLDFYESTKFKKGIDASFFLNFENVKERIVFKLINSKLNQSLLRKIPHKPFMDLEMVFYYIWDQKELENATVLIHNSHCEMWNVKPDELIKLAKRNTERLLPCETIKMEKIVVDMMKVPEDYFSEQGIDMKMYVMTNSTRSYGAATLLYDHAICEFAYTYGKNIFIIPSSVHELILIPDDGQIQADMLNEMVREVNHTQLDAKEVLADHIYYYDYVDDILTACLG